MTPASIIPVLGSRRPYADLNFAAGSFGLNGTSVSSLALLAGFTFTRASLAMGYDATGKLTYGPNNLCLQSQTFDSATWAKSLVTITANAATAPDGTLTADRFVSAGGAFPQIAQTITVPAGNIVVSFWVQSDGTSQIAQAVIFDGVTVPFTPTSTWTQVILSKTGGAGGSKSVVIATNNGSAGASSFYIWGAQLEAVTYQTTPSTYYPTTTAAYYGPRLVYDPVTLASQGILVEEARTNLCLQSSTFSTTWSAVQATVTANSATAPDGTLTADTVVPTTALNQHRLDQTTTITAAAHNASVYAKAAGYGFVLMRLGALGGIFNLTTGAFTNITGGAVGVATDVGNGWWRCSLQGTTAGSDTFRLGVTPSASSADYTGDGTSGVYFWGAQIEAGTGASSPIPTTTASVTRAADVATVTGLNMPYPLSVAAGYTKTFGASAGRAATVRFDGNNVTQLGVSTAPRPSLDVASGGTFQAQLSGDSTANGTSISAAARVATNDVAFAVQGVIVGTDVTVTPPPTSTIMGIGSNNAGEILNGTISRIRVYNRALTDAELQAITA